MSHSRTAASSVVNCASLPIAVVLLLLLCCKCVARFNAPPQVVVDDAVPSVGDQTSNLHKTLVQGASTPLDLRGDGGVGVAAVPPVSPKPPQPLPMQGGGGGGASGDALHTKYRRKVMRALGASSSSSSSSGVEVDDTAAPTPAPNTTTVAPQSPPPPPTDDVVRGNITADYDKGLLGRVQLDLLKAMGVAVAFAVLALLEVFLPKTTVTALSPGATGPMGLDEPLLEEDVDLLGTSLTSNGGQLKASPGSGTRGLQSLVVGGAAPVPSIAAAGTATIQHASAAGASAVASGRTSQTVQHLAPSSPHTPPPHSRRAAEDIDDGLIVDEDEVEGEEMTALL